jgi:hypothetical protein
VLELAVLHTIVRSPDTTCRCDYCAVLSDGPTHRTNDAANAVHQSIMRDQEQRSGPVPDRDEAVSDEDRDRGFLLECRLEQMRAAVDEARAEADRARVLLAESTARESDHARRNHVLHSELAAAREEVASLHRRLEHSEALRAGQEGRLFEAPTTDDARELVRLRGEAIAVGEVTAAHQRTVMDLRARVEKLVASRETLLTRVAEWQRSVREGDADAIDLAEFIAALRSDILELERRNVLAERREAGLRARLLELEHQVEQPAGEAAPTEGNAMELSSDAAATETGMAEPAANGERVLATEAEARAPALSPVDDAESRIDALFRLGRSEDADAFYVIRSWLGTAEPQVRAAAYQALGHLLERDPARLEPHIRWGIADPDARVRRRVVLAAAAARGLSLRPLLEPLRRDPDPQVRRVVHEVLRRTPPISDDANGAGSPSSEEVTSGVAS